MLDKSWAFIKTYNEQVHVFEKAYHAKQNHNLEDLKKFSSQLDYIQDQFEKAISQKLATKFYYRFEEKVQDELPSLHFAFHLRNYTFDNTLFIENAHYRVKEEGGAGKRQMIYIFMPANNEGLNFIVRCQFRQYSDEKMRQLRVIMGNFSKEIHKDISAFNKGLKKTPLNILGHYTSTSLKIQRYKSIIGDSLYLLEKNK